MTRVGKWGSGEVGKWGSGEVGKWGSGEVGKWGSGEVGDSDHLSLEKSLGRFTVDKL
ncbi:MAG: hypothetical protein JWS08_14695 [Phormidium sp. PBR-2020]|nr:MAG: hypothetical protein JWS08_14695 [Phormidium sp. PBR-2020]